MHYKTKNSPNISKMQEQLYSAKKKLRQARKITLNIPSGFSFNRGDSKNFNPVINFFDWNIRDCPVEIDFTGCSSANYQALSLIIPYCWHLKQNRCTISFNLDNKGDQSSSQMWRLMGSLGLFSVSTDHTINFKGYSKEKPLFAIRNSTDFKEALGNLCINPQRMCLHMRAGCGSIPAYAAI